MEADAMMAIRYFQQAAGTLSAAQREMGLVYLNGADGTKEESWYLGGQPLVARGVAVLCIEGPGQGEPPGGGVASHSALPYFRTKTPAPKINLTPCAC